MYSSSKYVHTKKSAGTLWFIYNFINISDLLLIQREEVEQEVKRALNKHFDVTDV